MDYDYSQIVDFKVLLTGSVYLVKAPLLFSEEWNRISSEKYFLFKLITRAERALKILASRTHFDY